ncbi:MAG: DNA translocase FtsK 4TM domain-containing protein [Chromatiales bacterium]|nr:DNA translocase FtsK 4TM domain-containing protein [Chromatiales bacterium]
MWPSCSRCWPGSRRCACSSTARATARGTARVTALIGAGFVLTVLGAGGLASLHFADNSALPFTSGGVLGNWVGQGLAGPLGFVGATIVSARRCSSPASRCSPGCPGSGSWTPPAAPASRWWHARARRSSALVDYAIGLRAKRQRRETVAEDKKVLEKHAPPRIEPVIKPIVKSERVEQREAGAAVRACRAAAASCRALTLLDAAPAAQGGVFSQEALEAMSRLRRAEAARLRRRGRRWSRCIPAR